MLDLRSVHGDGPAEGENAVELAILVESLEVVGEWRSIALRDSGGAGLACEICVGVEIRRTLGDAVVVVQIGSDAFGAISGDDGASGANRRAGAASDEVSHEVGAIDAGREAGRSVVEGKSH